MAFGMGERIRTDLACRADQVGCRLSVIFGDTVFDHVGLIIVMATRFTRLVRRKYSNINIEQSSALVDCARVVTRHPTAGGIQQRLPCCSTIFDYNVILQIQSCRRG